jgi:hypothetical protein
VTTTTAKCDGHRRFGGRSLVARLHIPVFVPVFGVAESRAGFLFWSDSGGIRPQHS